MPLNMADTRPVVDVGWLEMSKASGSYLFLSGAKLTTCSLCQHCFTITKLSSAIRAKTREKSRGNLNIQNLPLLSANVANL